MISKVDHTAYPTSLTFDLTGATSTTFQASSAPVAIARETEHSGRYSEEERRGMCSDTINPGGEVQIRSVGCILGMPEIAHFVFIEAASRYMGFQDLKKFFFKRRCFGCGGISCFFGTSVCAALIFERAGGASKPGPPLVTAAVCTEQHQMKVASCSQSYLTLLIEYGEGLQHTPELERRHQKICGML